VFTAETAEIAEVIEKAISAVNTSPQQWGAVLAMNGIPEVNFTNH
jgi:hypothetical protein